MDKTKKIKSFFDLETWQLGHQLVLAIYKITETFPRTEQFGISMQLKRASSSVTANIAEGFSRFHFMDKVRFYHQARASVAEMQNHLLLSKDLKFINEDKCNILIKKSIAVMQLINGLIRSTEKQNNLTKNK